MSKFQHIESWFAELHTAAAAGLSSTELDEIQKFIDVGEYGLALEVAVDICAEEKKAASTEVISIIERLAAAMDLDATPLRRWQEKKHE